MGALDKKFLDYYYREIDYLKNEGAIFASEFPKVAGRLNFDLFETNDPHVARLIESFAFLTAKVQYNLDNVASEITDSLINVLYPHINRILPSMSIAKFQINDGGNMPPVNGFNLKKGTELFTYSSNESICRFTTVYDLDFFPVKVSSINILPKDNYRFVPVPNTVEFGYKKYQKTTTYYCEVEIECLDGFFSDLSINNFLFYLNISDNKFKTRFYRSIFSNNSLVYCVKNNEITAIPMPPKSLKAVGFKRDEMAIIPDDQESHAYQLLQEYFHFPDKFMFIKIDSFDFLKYIQNNNFLNTNKIKILIPLSDANNDWSKKINNESLMINCVPIINLYKTTTDPIPFDRKQVFYPLVPNVQQDRTMEIYKIEKVFSIDAETGEEKEISPYFSFKTVKNFKDDDGLYWWSKNIQTRHKNIVGFDTKISFVDTKFNIIDPKEYIIYAKAFCTNRFLAEDVQKNAELQLEKAAPIDSVICLTNPISPQYFLDTGDNNTKLISQLSVNYLGFPYSLNNDISKNLKNILMMHVSKHMSGQVEAMLNEIENIYVTKKVKRVGRDSWRGGVEGVHIDICLNKTIYKDEWFLLSMVLLQYFSMNCQINSFVDLSLKLNDVVIADLDELPGEMLSI